MTALPPITDLTNSATTEGQAKTWFGNLRGYLSGLFGEDGARKTANQTLGTLFNKIVSKSSAYTVATTDLGVLIDCTGTWTLSILAGATAGDGFTFAARNSGAGAITLDPNGSETIDDALTIILQPGATVILTWDTTAAKWKAQWSRVPNRATAYAAAGGTSDAITATFYPPITALSDGLSVLVRAGAANANVAPTFAPDGLAAKTIVKGANKALSANDINGAGHWIELQFDATLDKWELLNPASPITPFHDYQVFTTNGTWTKPSWLTGDELVIVEIWGGGGGGYPYWSYGGGGGGAYNCRRFKASELGSSVSVTVGSGGAVGNPGYTTSFGTHLYAYGGASNQTGNEGSGGGGTRGAGSGVNGGPGYSSMDAGGNAGGGSSFWGGGGGGSSGIPAGGSSMFGGGGGGNASSGGGASCFGGNGGAAGAPGVVPGGGGGSNNVGARGEVRVRVIA